MGHDFDSFLATLIDLQAATVDCIIIRHFRMHKEVGMKSVQPKCLVVDLLELVSGEIHLKLWVNIAVLTIC